MKKRPLLARSATAVSIALASLPSCSVEDGRDLEFEEAPEEGMTVSEPRGGSSGSAPVSPSGGTTTTGGQSASGGRASGSGGAPPQALDCSSPTTGNDLLPKNGWVSRSSNCAGIQGLFWTASDSHSTITPAESADIAEPACVQGTLAQAVDADFDTFWGAALGITLNQPAPSTERLVYDATAAGVSGFRFVISGEEPAPAGRLRFNVIDEDDQNYCVPLVSAGSTSGHYEISFDQLRRDCWDADSTALVDPSRILVAQFSLVTSAEESTPFSFCVESVGVIRSAPGGEP